MWGKMSSFVEEPQIRNPRLSYAFVTIIRFDLYRKKLEKKMSEFLNYLPIIFFATITIWLLSYIVSKKNKILIDSGMMGKAIDLLHEYPSFQEMRFRLGDINFSNIFNQIKGKLKKELELVRYVGEVKIQNKIYVHENMNIEIKLMKTLADILIRADKLLKKSEHGNDNVEFQTEHSKANPHYLCIELQGANMDVDGEKSQMQVVGADDLIFHWSISFPHSGNFTPRLIFKIKTGIEYKEIGEFSSQIKVVKLDGLLHRDIYLLTVLGTIITLGLSLIKILQLLKVL
jgi:hypothetical protein